MEEEENIEKEEKEIVEGEEKWKGRGKKGWVDKMGRGEIKGQIMSEDEKNGMEKGISQG